MIEIDPSYTHNIIGNHWTKRGLSSSYHREKSKIAERNGFRCIHIFDWDDWSLMKNIFCSKEYLNSSDFTVYRLAKEVADKFLIKNHYQGTCRNQVMYLGLVQNREIYQVLSLGRSRYSTNHSVQIMRMCTKLGYEFRDGYNTLFSYVTSEYGLYDIIAYCDQAKSDGSEYLKIGMKFVKENQPKLIWSKDKKYITEGLRMSKKISKEQLLENGWLPVYDCGQLVFEY